MAINYTELFTDIGKIIKAANEFPKPAISGGIPNLATLLSEIHGVFADNVAETIDGIEREFFAYRNAACSSASRIASRVDRRLLHKETILDELNKGDLTIDSLLIEIYRDMLAKTESIDDRICRVGDPDTLTGNHDGASDSAILTDSGQSWTAGSLVGLTITNNTSGASGTITANTATTITATLTGGAPDNDWDFNDAFTISGNTAWGPNFATTTDSNGNGTLSGSLILDGVTPPSPGWPRNPLYAHPSYPTNYRLSELVTHKERVLFTCVSDESTGAAEGEEVFRGETDPAGANEFDWRALMLDREAGFDALGNPGSGASLTLSTVQSSGTLANMSFESWFNTNEPESWTIDNGVAGTNIIQETALVNVHRGNGALKLVTSASLHQAVIRGSVLANKRYLFGAYVKTETETSGNLVLRLVSPSGQWTTPSIAPAIPPVSGPNASEGGEIDLDLTGYGTQDWVWNEGWINMPAVIPDDLEMHIVYTGGNGTVWIDSMGFGPALFLGGIGYAITAGSTQFLLGDRFSITNSVDNDSTDGVFQKFFHRRYHQQLPSQPTGFETQGDVLAL